MTHKPPRIRAGKPVGFGWTEIALLAAIGIDGALVFFGLVYIVRLVAGWLGR